MVVMVMVMVMVGRSKFKFKNRHDFMMHISQAEQLRKQQMDLKRNRANNENLKVDEVQFITSLTRVGEQQDMKNGRI